MKKSIIMILAITICTSMIYPQKKVTLKTKKQKESYSIGVNIAKSIQMNQIDVDVNVLTQAFKDVFGNAKLQMTEEEMKNTLDALDKEMNAKMQEKQKEIAQQNQRKGKIFLEANKKKSGVITLPSGLQYKVIKAGMGPKPTKEQTVKCHYRGTLIDGTEFDSSFKRGEPAEFNVSQVIPGWTEALQLMPLGSKWQLFIPSDLAYGPNGAGNFIGPDETLIFEVELLNIQ